MQNMDVKNASNLRELTIEILQKCTNNCVFCSSNSTMDSIYKIDLESFKKIIDDAVNMGVTNLYISGGEPFLHEELLMMVSYAKNKSLRVSLYTSGITLNLAGEFISIKKEDLKKLKSMGLDVLVFDIQTAKIENYNMLMGTQEKFYLAVESIRRSMLCLHNVEFHFIPTRKNYLDLESVLNLARRMKVSKVSLLRFVAQGRGFFNREILELKDEELVVFKKEIHRLKEMFPEIKLRIGIPLEDNSCQHFCTACDGKIVIRYDGSVYPCEAYKWVEFIIYETYFMYDLIIPPSIFKNSLSEIYLNSSWMKRLREDKRRFLAKEDSNLSKGMVYLNSPSHGICNCSGMGEEVFSIKFNPKEE